MPNKTEYNQDWLKAKDTWQEALDNEQQAWLDWVKAKDITQKAWDAWRAVDDLEAKAKLEN